MVSHPRTSDVGLEALARAPALDDLRRLHLDQGLLSDRGRAIYRDRFGAADD
jgi:hypothetical protein